MNDKLKKRITMFYIAGVVNLLIGGYILLFGRSFLPADKINLLLLFFMGFAALDFWMPRMIKKKWAEDQKKLEQQHKAQGGQPPHS